MAGNQRSAGNRRVNRHCITGPKPLQPLLQRPVSVRTSAVRTGFCWKHRWKHQPWKPAFACQHPCPLFVSGAFAVNQRGNFAVGSQLAVVTFW